MARIPTRFYGPAQVATGPATVITVASSEKYIIRNIHVQNPSASPVTFTLAVGTDAAGKRLWDAFSIPAQAAGVTANVIDWWGYLVMDAAEIMQLAAGTNNILVITVDGERIVLG